MCRFLAGFDSLANALADMIYGLGFIGCGKHGKSVPDKGGVPVPRGFSGWETN